MEQVKLNEQEIIEGNKLIAEFMGCNYGHGFFAVPDEGYRFPTDTLTRTPDQLLYHISDEWIDPVIKKLEEMQYEPIVEDGFCNIGQFSSYGTNAKFISASQVIKWYNSQKL